LFIDIYHTKLKNKSMKTPRPYRHNPRFKRIYSEFENLSDEIWDIETGDRASVPDDFMFALKLQTHYLEDEIDHWLDLKDEESIE